LGRRFGFSSTVWSSIHLVARQHTSFNASRLPYDSPEEFGDRAVIQRSAVGLLQSAKNQMLPFRVAARQSRNFLEGSHLHGEPRAPVKKLKQLPVKIVYFVAPIFDIHTLMVLFVVKSGVIGTDWLAPMAQY
jgi:hypothetical protein